MIKLMEIYETDKISTSIKSGPVKKYLTREVFVNPDHVVCIRVEAKINELVREGRCTGVPENTSGFTRLHMNRGQSGIDLIVAGSPEEVKSRLFRELLKG